MMPTRTLSALALALLASLAGCNATAPTAPAATTVPEQAQPLEKATPPPTSAEQTPEAIVAGRSKAYWQARIAGDVEAAYELTPPSYRAINSLASFRLKHGARPGFGTQEVVKVQCQEQRCEATSRFKAFVPLAPAVRPWVGKTDVWVFEQAQWWIFVQ